MDFRSRKQTAFSPSATIDASGLRRLSSERWLLVAATLVSFALWYIPGAQILLYPICLFVTLIYEGGHAVMTVLTGGPVAGMAIRQDGSGVTMSLRGMPFFVYMAGYLGATAFGAMALQMCRRAGNGRRLLLFLAAVVFVVTGLWLRPWGDSAFGFFVGVGVGSVLLAAARFLKEPQAAFLTAFGRAPPQTHCSTCGT